MRFFCLLLNFDFQKDENKEEKRFIWLGAL